MFLPLDNKLFLLARQLGVLKREAFLWTGDPYKAEAGEADQGRTSRSACAREIAWLRLGDLDIAAIPGEIYPELVLDKVQDPADPGADFPDAPVEPAIYKQLRGPHRMLIGLASDEIGYIIPKRQWDEKAALLLRPQENPVRRGQQLGTEHGTVALSGVQGFGAGQEVNRLSRVMQTPRSKRLRSAYSAALRTG